MTIVSSSEPGFNAQPRAAQPYDQAGSQNVFFGPSAGISVINARGNVGIGNQALEFLQTGIGNTALGQQALMSLVGTNDNTAVGTGALFSLFDGAANIAIGEQACFSQTSSNYNIGIGSGALFFYTSSVVGTIASNIAIGHNAMKNADIGYSNVALGEDALLNAIGPDVSANTALGPRALRELHDGYNNVGVGADAGRALDQSVFGTGATRNTIIGQSAGYTDGTSTTKPDLVNSTLIGYGAQSVNADNVMVFGSEIAGYRVNYAFGSAGRVNLFGGGVGVIAIAPAQTNPTTNPVGCSLFYVDQATGQTCIVSPSGTRTVIAPP